MSAYHAMRALHARLIGMDIPCVIPEAESDVHAQVSEGTFEDFKRDVSFAYLQEVRKKSTYAILAVNLEKHGTQDYVGPNTFAEIAVAFSESKRIYLWHGMPDVYRDELSSWGAVSLDGDLDRLVKDYEHSFAKGPSDEELQTTIPFDDLR
jgi:hypothetical protein